MKKIIHIQLGILICFFTVFKLLQSETVYRYSLGLIAKNWQNVGGERTLESIPYSRLSNSSYVHWDGEHYFRISKFGYDQEKAGGDYTFAFFPLFPLVWKLSMLPPVGILFLNYFMFSLGFLILLRLFSSSSNYFRDAILCSTLPGLVIFLIPYSEAIFFLTVALGAWGLMKEKYWVYFVGFLLAALTRPAYTFLLLSITGVELFFVLQHQRLVVAVRNVILRILPLLLGTAIVSAIQLSYGSGGLLKFVEVQKYWDNILSVPHNLRDWSHEGFSINIGVIFMVFAPLVMVGLLLLSRQIGEPGSSVVVKHRSRRDYMFLLSVIYTLGSALFILLFRGGSLHCLFRFTLCTPFFFVLLLAGFEYIREVPVFYRFFSLGTLALLSIFVLGVSSFSTYWDFADFGLFLLIGSIGFWLFQDFSHRRIYQVGLVGLLLLNLLWTTYLFNTYIVDAWIFA